MQHSRPKKAKTTVQATTRRPGTHHDTLDENATPSKKTLIDLPAEIITEILSHIKVTDMKTMFRVSKAINGIVHTHKGLVIPRIMDENLQQKATQLPLPKPLKPVQGPAAAQTRYNLRMQFMLGHSKTPSSVRLTKPFAQLQFCACSSCVERWLNLHAALSGPDRDFHAVPASWYWAHSTHPYCFADPDKNRTSAELVTHALTNPFAYVRLLEKATVCHVSETPVCCGLE
jgi:hypothetical protein